MGDPQNGWFTIKKSIKMDGDWGYPYFRKPPFHHVLVGKERLDSELNIWRQEFYERSESYDVLQWIRMQ
jgi:hypothetical protein